MKRIITLFMAVLVFLSTPLTALAGNFKTQDELEQILDDTLGDVMIYADHDFIMQYMEYDGHLKLAKFYAYTNNMTSLSYPAYCMEPDKNGASVKSHSVDTSNIITNPKTWGILTSGYPYKTYEELGLDNKYQAYYATKMAMWTYIESWDIDKWSASSQEGAAKVVEACKKIYQAGMKVNEIPKAKLVATPDKTIPEKDDINSNYVSTTYTVTSGDVSIKSYEVYFDDIVPEGTIITDLQNNERYIFDTGEKFKVLIPANSIAGKTGEIKVGVIGKMITNVVLYGASYDPDMQSYALTKDPSTFTNAKSTITYSSQSTMLEIIKTADGTNTPLAGATFRVSDSEGGVIRTYTTDSTGKVIVPLSKSGLYYIDEITPPKGYSLSELSHKDVQVTWEKTTVTFTNKENPKLTIQKIDSETGQRVAGATLRIAKDGGNSFIDVTTDSAGMIYLEDMESGTYTITEIVAPPGYVLDSTPQIVKLESGKTTTVTMKNSKAPGIIIKKYDEMTATVLKNAEFSVAKKGGSIIYEGVTDENGMIQLTSLEEGWYTITELAAPEGYIITTDSKDVYLEAGKTVEVKFDNRRKPSLQIIKLDEETRQPLEGAVFKVRKAGDSSGNEYVTDSEGLITINDLEEAVYIIEEVKAPEGYLNESVTKEIELTWGLLHQVVFTNKAKPALEILKVDEETNQPLAGAKFRVKETEGGTFSDYITGEDGRIHITGLVNKIYTIEEIAAPEGYLLDTQHRDVKLEWGKTTKLVFTNKAKPALEILKVDEETKEALAGAKFLIKTTEGSTVGEYITNEQGLILIRGLEERIYTVEEIAAPKGYLLETQHKDIALEWGKTKTLVFTNKAEPALEIIKLDEETRQPLKGAKFRVTETEGNVVGEYITDEKGIILITGLKDQMYTIEEVTAPEGYLLETQHKDVKLEWGKTTSIIFTNKAHPALEILKIDTVTGKPLAGARFRVTKTESLTVSEYITDDKGLIRIENLDEETYTVEEIAAPDGYILGPQLKQIQLEWGKTKRLLYENTKKPTLIIIKISGTTFQPIPNTTLKIEYELENGGVKTLGEMRTDENGQIIIPNTDPGWYIITETKAAPGYSISSNPVTRKYLSPGENAYTSFSAISTVSGGTSGDIIEVSYGNDYQTEHEIVDYPLNSLIIRKISNATGELLSGAVFELRKVTEEVTGSSGTVIGRYTTNYSGIVVVTGLEPGGYIVEEVTAPENYLLSENSMQQVWMKADGTSIVELTFANIPYGNILVTKVDAMTGKPLAGARFRVTDGTGAVVGTSNGIFITDENGVFLVSNVKPGSYVITEIEAPEYYTIDTTPQTIHVGTDGKTYQVSFQNQPSASILIRKLDTNTREPLENAQFKVIKSSGDVVGTGNGIYTTDADGTVLIPYLEKGSYVIEEIKAPDGYLLENQTQTIEVDYGRTYTIDFYNKPFAGVIIKKIDSQTKQPLAGASFKIIKKSGEEIGTYQTDGNGIIQADDLEPGWYSAVETKAPDGYLIDNQAQDFEITHTKTLTLTFENHKKSSLVVKKLEEGTKQPLAGAEFSIKTIDGTIIGSYTTGADGTFQLSELEPGWYVVQETKAPAGYLIDGTAQKVEIIHNQLITLEFYNQPLASIQIKKLDAVTSSPLAGADFLVKKQDGTHVGEYTTGSDGTILISGIEPGWYVISETQAPEGYHLDNTAKTIEVKAAVPSVVTFTNKPYSGIEILKLDSINGNPLAGAEFKVTKDNGEEIGTYKTDNSGKILVTDLAEGTYIISEVKAPKGYILSEMPKTVIVKSGRLTTAEFTNKPYSGIQILKTDESTGTPLKGAVFAVKKSDGTFIGEFETDTAGTILVTDLQEGVYIVSETKAPENYILDSTAKTVSVVSGRLAEVKVTNKSKGGIQIIKVDAKTGKVLAGAVFHVTRLNGETIGTYKTDKTGQIYIPALEPDWYSVTETKAPEGYFLNSEPQKVQVTWGKTVSIEIENQAMASLLIQKTDSLTGVPLEGVTFAVSLSNGERIGTYTTDADGRIYVNQLEAGLYHVSETKAPKGYLQDNTVYEVVLKAGTQSVLEVENQPLGGIRLTKIDSVTKKPIQGVEFMLFDSSNKVVDVFYTDNNGRIDFPNTIPEGRYTIRETRAASGYDLDHEPKTVEFQSGKVTEIVWENTPQMGQIQITKKSGDDNEMNGFAKGTLLEGAVFEVYDYKTGNLIDRFVSGNDGRAVSSPLPLGRYTVKVRP